MLTFWRRLFFPIFYLGGGGGDSAGADQAAEESRKAALRSKIDAMYGIDDGATPPPGPGDAKAIGGMIRSIVPTPDAQASIDQQNADAANAARAQMATQEGTIGDATRSYYNDKLARNFSDANLQNQFSLARRSLQGGSSDIDSTSRLQEDRDLGASRVSDAVTSAINDLRTQREQERQNAINLVNAGAGDSAVAAAQAGLKNSFDRASSTQKADLFGDLFQAGADQQTANNIALNQSLYAQAFNRQLQPFFSVPRTTSSGRVT